MGRLLAVKVGNSEVRLGLFQGEILLGSWAASSSSISTADEAAFVVDGFLQMRDLPEPDCAIMCSVTPLGGEPWFEGLRDYVGVRPLVVGPGLKSGIALGYKDPGQVGADRVANAVAARELVGAPVIVADFGTTTNLTVVDKGGTLLGGVIASGLRTSLDALCGSAAQLAGVSLLAPRKVIGRTTADAMRSGIVLGEAARVCGLVDAIWDELGYQTTLVATGRYAPVVCPASTLSFELRDDLALQGLRLIFSLNANVH